MLAAFACCWHFNAHTGQFPDTKGQPLPIPKPGGVDRVVVTHSPGEGVEAAIKDVKQTERLLANFLKARNDGWREALGTPSRRRNALF